ncbi:hypothetical protein KIN20_014273 [Parelaphostrongylus tenuis]|uniref:Uncharacterized protein n=1 Tax=Parelaphostrongylus tenuis TaxID=148309 RepID=A0AAD5MGW7_PARTN|nr:hypothetical protein KIN20_014273 [Parelaphostrongylus tenuis]
MGLARGVDRPHCNRSMMPPQCSMTMKPRRLSTILESHGVRRVLVDVLYVEKMLQDSEWETHESVSRLS